MITPAKILALRAELAALRKWPAGFRVGLASPAIVQAARRTHNEPTEREVIREHLTPEQREIFDTVCAMQDAGATPGGVLCRGGRP